MAAWPSNNDVTEWLDVPDPGPNPHLVDQCRLAAKQHVLARCPDIEDVDNNNEIPDSVRLAVMMQSVRWYRRQGSPEGIGGFVADEVGGTVAFDGLDRDIYEMIRPHRYYPIG